MQCDRQLPAFCKNLLPPYSTLKMEAASPSEIIAAINETTLSHNPEELNLNFDCCEYLKFYIF
jgi:hypothetical protein